MKADVQRSSRIPSVGSRRQSFESASLPQPTVVTLTNRQIQSLQDDILADYRSSSRLNLAHNRLSSLAGLVAFQALEELDLSNNHLSEVTELMQLTGLPRLQVLTLTGNPVNAFPLTRLVVAGLLPVLRLLNGERVSLQERKLSVGYVSRLEGLVVLLAKYDSQISLLQHFKATLLLHEELLVAGKVQVRTSPNAVFLLQQMDPQPSLALIETVYLTTLSKLTHQVFEESAWEELLWRRESLRNQAFLECEELSKKLHPPQIKEECIQRDTHNSLTLIDCELVDASLAMIAFNFRDSSLRRKAFQWFVLATARKKRQRLFRGRALLNRDRAIARVAWLSWKNWTIASGFARQHQQGIKLCFRSWAWYVKKCQRIRSLYKISRQSMLAQAFAQLKLVQLPPIETTISFYSRKDIHCRLLECFYLKKAKRLKEKYFWLLHQLRRRRRTARRASVTFDSPLKSLLPRKSSLGGPQPTFNDLRLRLELIESKITRRRHYV